MGKLIAIIVMLLILQSCSSIKSLNKVTKKDDGLRYYMPKKNLIIIVKTKDEQVDSKVEIDKVTISTSDSFPDLSKLYMLQYSYHLLANNETNIVITPSGLLTSLKSKFESTIGTAITNLASSAGTKDVSFLNSNYPDQKKKKLNCIQNRTYVYSIDFMDEKTTLPLPCGLEVLISLLVSDKEFDEVVFDNDKSDGKHSGIFYKQDLPYLITIKNSNQDKDEFLFYQEKIVMSPSESGTYYMPITKSLLANNNSEFGFTDGVINSIKINSEGDLTALLKYPANILTSYFTAVGNMFSLKNTSLTNESNYINNSIQIELLRIKLNQCLDAISSNDIELIASLGCSSE